MTYEDYTVVLTILKILSFIFILWCIINYDKFGNKYHELIKRRLYRGDDYIKEVNRITNYKTGD